MIRMSKLSDYGLVLLTHLARHPERAAFSAVDLAAETKLPAPTVGKLLKILAREGLLESHRGSKGGYSLVAKAQDISVAHILQALEGPISITQCVEHEGGLCEYEPVCPTKDHWHVINRTINRALSEITLRELAGPMPVKPLELAR